MPQKHPDVEDLNESVPKSTTTTPYISSTQLPKIYEFGLTGGIGSGKSTVAKGLEQFGATIIDADQIVRELQHNTSAQFQQIVDTFGTEIVTADGQLDRKALAEIVFNTPYELEKLNAIIHPAVYDKISETIETLKVNETGAIVVHDVPLLIEHLEKSPRELIGIIVIDTDIDTAIDRLITSRGYSRIEAEKRISAQVSRESRLAHADYIIENNSTLKELDIEIEKCWQWILQKIYFENDVNLFDPSTVYKGEK